jgi:pimeloyl-ACP methyl ester carboxylesterase
MKKEMMKIENIPTILWGEKSNSIYIYVHGKLSSKEDAEDFSEKAVPRGYQVLSFDLPEHGDRKGEDYPCMVWNGIRDLGTIGNYVLNNWNDIYLFGSSLGAHFSLLAYKDFPIRKCLFLSPVLDMERLIQNMMKWSYVTEQDLKEKQEILTSMGETIYWDYYCYVIDNPIIKWGVPTAILYGSEDNITEREVVERFVKQFNCAMTVLEGGEHWFHTAQQIAFYEKWLDENI